MNNFQSFLDEANAYFRIVNNSLAKKGKLGTKVLYSLSTMAIEKYLVALLISKGKTVTGHNLNTLISLVNKNFENVPKEITTLAKAEERIDLCSFSPVNSIEPSLDEIQKLTGQLVVLKDFVHQHCIDLQTVNE